MIDRRSLRFRLTLLYTAMGSVVLGTAGLALTFAVFAVITRPIALSLAQTSRNIEMSAAEAPASEPVESIQRRIVARETRNGILVIAIPVNATHDGPMTLPPGDFSVAALLGIFPNFARVRNASVVVIPDRAKTDGVMRAYVSVVALTVTLALFVAWLVARIVTRETLKPLLTVTAELERFARGDFSPRPLKVANQTEFGALAAAYNGAAHQVTEAFLERRRVEEKVRQFVADAGHELRTPLTVVAGYIDVLRRGGFDDPAIRRAASASLTIEVKRMRTLVERLMTLARLDRVLEAEPEVVDVGAIVKHAVEALAVTTQTSVAVHATDDRFVLGEPGDVYEAVANLVENAIKYGEGTAVSVIVTAEADAIAIRVRDGGPGISEIHRLRIFERFYRATDRGEIAGSGLGLAIAEKAAERLGGRITLEDARPGWTTFALIVPALNGIGPSPQRAARTRTRRND